MRFPLFILFLIPISVFGQHDIQQIIDIEYEKGHFNGTILYIDKGQSIKIDKGLANIQFDVAINDNTRFPIASVTKLFTTIVIIQLQEKGRVSFDDKLGNFIPDIAEDCRDIRVRDLILHYSGLENEPIKAVVNKYSIDEYIHSFVKKKTNDTLEFNYNNVDFVLLSKIIETVTEKSFSKAIEELIISPLDMENTGFVSEREVIKNLAYGYHNYSFGEGEKDEPLFNDRRYISNYYGAGGMYSTTGDLYKLLMALKNNQLISEKAKNQFVLKPQTEDHVDWLSGRPTFGFYYDDNQEAPVFRRGGSIDGFNAEIIVNRYFDKILIILCNTDTADLEALANRIYFNRS